MFRKSKLFIPGIILFIIMFPLYWISPECPGEDYWIMDHSKSFWPICWGEENGPIENTQMVVIAYGLYYCYTLAKQRLKDWGGCQKALWGAGGIFFFLVAMREISWGRVFFRDPTTGNMIEYAEMGLYGKMVHPLVAILLVAFVYLCYKGKVWRFIMDAKISWTMTLQMVGFVVFQWLAEHNKLSFFQGDVAEELAELGAYLMIVAIFQNMVEQLKEK